MNDKHTIERFCKRIGEYGIDDLSIFDIDRLTDLLKAEQKRRWARALEKPTFKRLGLKA